MVIDSGAAVRVVLAPGVTLGDQVSLDPESPFQLFGSSASRLGLVWRSSGGGKRGWRGAVRGLPISVSGRFPALNRERIFGLRVPEIGCMSIQMGPSAQRAQVGKGFLWS
jgi:hypothetical protein